MSISSWEDQMRHFQTQSRWTILHVLMVASVQLNLLLSWRKPTKNVQVIKMHDQSTRPSHRPNTYHCCKHATPTQRINAEAINSKRVIWSKSTWCDSKRTVMMFLEMNKKKLKTGNPRRLKTWTHSFPRVQCVHFNMIFFTNALCKDGCVRGVC